MTRWWIAAAGALLVAACNRGGRKPGVPADTALRVPFDTAARLPDTGLTAPANTSAVLLGAADSAARETSVVLLADSAAGDAIYHGKARCFTCHGDRGEGTARLGPSLADSVWMDGDGSLASIDAVIANGVATPRATAVAMPAYGRMLSPAEMARVAAYVYTLSHRGAAVADTSRADSALAGTPRGADSTAAASAVPHDSTRTHGAP